MRKSLLCAALALALLVGAVGGANADSILQRVIPAVAGGAAVMAVAKPLNNFINSLMASNGVANRDHTKVVPILTLGGNSYIGAAQVSGPSYNVNRVMAVIAYKGQWNNGVWNIDGLVPIDNLNPAKGLKRVYGTGVDAIVNAKL